MGEPTPIPWDRFWRLPEDEVDEMRRKADRAKAAWDLLRKVDDVAIGLISEAPDINSGVAAKMLDILEATNVLREHLPIPAYIAPIKRWGGGPVEMDNWYWDRP